MKNHATELREAIRSTYKIYGYELAEDRDNVQVFLLKQGMYHGAEVIFFDPSCEKAAENLKSIYATLGYSTQMRSFKNQKELSRLLYSGFFQVEALRSRIDKKYHDYTSSQSKNLGTDYVYVDVQYSYDGPNPNNSELPKLVSSLLSSDEPTLIILEAAAGFGKTCTAYEITKAIQNDYPDSIPLLTELSRNRGANIFRYVLLDEIDREFPYLNSRIVQYEITNGQIILIIDGFDELIDKSISPKSVQESDLEADKTESMLQTIRDLLIGRTKIILTTRSTAILPKGMFEGWVDEAEDTTSIHRILIKEPDITDWIGPEKQQIINISGFPIEDFAHPVLLSWMRSLDNNSFQTVCDNPNNILRNFFEYITKREMTRQAITLEPTEQMKIFTTLAKNFIELGISSESKLTIKELIHEYNLPVLNDGIARQNTENRRTIEDLVDTLSNHALLNRAGRNEDQIGFINDYVWGYFCGQVILESPIDWVAKYFLDEALMDLLIIGNSLRSSQERTKIYQSLNPVIEYYPETQKFLAEANLRSTIFSTFENLVCSDQRIFRSEFRKQFTIRSSYFVNCTFKHCSINLVAFENVHFYGCTFDNTKFESTQTLPSSRRIQLIDPKYINCSEPIFPDSEEQVTAEDTSRADISKRILENFWPQGRPNANFTRLTSTLLKGFGREEMTEVNRILEVFRKEGIISFQNQYAKLNREKLVEIKEILERQ